MIIKKHKINTAHCETQNDTLSGIGYRHLWTPTRNIRIPNVILASLLLALICQAANLVTSTVDSGGGRSSSTNYTMDSSIGAITGISTGGNTTLRSGYYGQLAEVTALSLTGTPVQVPENTTSQFSGIATLDDDTYTLVPGSEIVWQPPTLPIVQIKNSGLAAAGTVYTNQPATVNGYYMGIPGSGSLMVLDTDQDNFGLYTGDGLPDWWQVRYFGINNPDAAPERDVTGTGQNNMFKYIAGLDPTNPASVFQFRIEPVSGQPNQKRLVFSPCLNDRTYTPLFKTNLLLDSWQPLESTSVIDNSTERIITDTNATDNTRFYRIQIMYPSLHY